MWTSLHNLKNVLSLVYRSYILSFRMHGYAWKTTIVTQGLLNTCEYASRRNSPFGVASSIFFDNSICIAVKKSVHKMHIAIFHVGKTKGMFAIHYSPTDCSAHAKVTALPCLVVGQEHWTSMTSRNAYSTSTPMKATLFSGHYLRNRSNLDIGILGYIGTV